MRILLIVPAFEDVYGSFRHIYKKGFLNPPMSLCYIAAALEEAGYAVKIVDGEAEKLSIRQIIDIAKTYEAGLFCLTATSIDFDKAKLLGEELKKEFSQTPIIIGGTHINIFGKQVLEDMPEADFGCIGDGEDLIVELANALSAGKSELLEGIAGLIFRKNNLVIQNKLRVLEKNLDCYTFPARHLLKNELYARTIPYEGYQVTASFMSTRGCPYSCVYCAVKNIYGGENVRVRSAVNVVEELEYIVNKMNIRHIAFNDDCLTINKNRIFEICDLIQKKDLKFTWEGLSRADLVDKKLLTEMKKRGFNRISFGIESGNPEILKVLQKNETLEQIKEAFKISREVGIVARGSVLIGSPFETRKTVKDTFCFIRKLKGLDEVVINILQPYPGTKVRQMVLEGVGGASFCNETDKYENLQRFGSASIKVNDLDPKKLIFLQKWGFLMFYSRPGVVLNCIKIMGLKTFFESGINFFRTLFESLNRKKGKHEKEKNFDNNSCL
ncbi:MAG: radical SAM protein [Candidatus Omnitrophota bacterium]